MLWSVIFKYHLELQHHTEAYAAIVHNPDKTRRENCLRHFIITLCDRGLFHEICTYPYVNLQEEVRIISVLFLFCYVSLEFIGYFFRDKRIFVTCKKCRMIHVDYILVLNFYALLSNI